MQLPLGRQKSTGCGHKKLIELTINLSVGPIAHLLAILQVATIAKYIHTYTGISYMYVHTYVNWGWENPESWQVVNSPSRQLTKSSIIFISLNVSNDGRERKSFTSSYFLLWGNGLTAGDWESGNWLIKCALMRYVLNGEWAANVQKNKKYKVNIKKTIATSLDTPTNLQLQKAFFRN